MSHYLHTLTKHNSLRSVSVRPTCCFFFAPFSNWPPFSIPFPRASFVFEKRAGKNTLIWSSPPSIFPSSCYAWIAVGCLKCFWHCLVILEHCVLVWSPYRRLCLCRLVLYEMMRRSVFMHMPVLAIAERACGFTSYHTSLLLTPTSLHCALIPPHPFGFPLFYPHFPLGMWLMLHRLFVHTAQVTLRIGGCVCLGSFGRRERQRQALKLSHR